MSLSDDLDRAQLLDGLPLVTLMPADVRRLVTASFVARSYAFGEVIVRVGDPADAYYVLISGQARVLGTSIDGGEVVLNTLGPGEAFGEVGLLDGGARTATVRASAPVEALRLDGGVLRALMATYPEVRRHVELAARRYAIGAFLLRSAPFARLPEAGLETLLDALQPVTAAPGDVVVREGEPPGALFAVEEGRLRAWRAAAGDLAYYRSGDVFGERALLTGEPRAATVEAVTACRLLRLPAESVSRLLAEHPAFRAAVEDQVAGYDYRRAARVPLDFAEELLPAEAAALSNAASADQAGAPPSDAAAAREFAATDSRPGRRIRRWRLQHQVDEADCGAACMAMCCRHFGRRVSLARARRAVRTSIDGTSLQGLARGAEELGLAARAVKLSHRHLHQVALPAIVHWGGNHWVVVYDVRGSTVRLADPALGLRRLSRARFDEEWTGYAVLLERTPVLDDTPEGIPARRWLWPFFRPYGRAIIGASLLALAVAGMQLAVPVFLQVVVDRVLPARDIGLLRLLLATFGGLLVAMTVATAVQRWLLARAAVHIDAATMDHVTSRLLALPLHYFATRRTGDLQRRLSGMRLVREFAVESGVVALTAAMQLVAAVVLMALTDRVLALVFLATTPLYAGLMRLGSTRLRPIFHSLEESFSRYASRQIDAVKGIEAVKAMGAEDRLRRQMLEEFAGLSQRLFRADFTAMGYQGAVQLTAFLSLALFVWAGAVRVLDGGLSIGELVAFSALVALANPAIVTLLSLWDAVQQYTVLITRLNDVFEEEPEQGTDRARLTPVRSLSGAVRLERVGFRYGGPESAAILADVSLDVPAGTTVAIVGRSGSGKTTLAKLLAGLLEPTSGRILYDGVDLVTLDYRTLRQRIGFVLQDNYLFADTIAGNIALGADDVDQERVETAARVANAHDFVVRLPFGYDTLVGESGLLLSGGQRQRIAIARALYHRPPLLILDEATSSLDTESERAVQENMDRVLEGLTSFVIAHRLSTIRAADVIVVLDDGCVVEQGTHDELMARRGLYFYLSSQQLDL